MTVELAVLEQVRALLGELRRELGARRASVVPRGGVDPAVVGVGGLRTLPLGGGARLEVELGPLGRTDEDVDVALERAARALRELAREAGAALPALDVIRGPAERSGKVRERVRSFLEALAALQHAINALCLVDGDLVASAQAPTELEFDRADLLVRRAQAAARARGTGHADLADPDAFVLTFWHRAALVIYFADAYAVDFVRHRSRQVARELALLLPELDPEPAVPAAIRPPPG